ncbi:glycosyltransferase family 39 protein [Hymenobacter sp. BT175]|uniref:ArnT family glycosyltransferase n=1 Tax=Hymenobacter translucens TaxID=2886507 RepID=UPI001D0ED995|nr:glycosyltransferase family 39 protein [Hymenobacter translucens]MCC2545881.1 glycosyltransferase family 39 protein [Hymenobacter translucens]
MVSSASVSQPARFAGYAARTRKWLTNPENQLLLLLLLLAAVPLLYELGRHPIQLWDESRLAVNAAEMSRNGNLLVTHFEGQPDHWNTKPPLLIWLQALSFTLFGYSTWALRLPTALATLGTLILLYRFAARDLRMPLAGFFAGLVLVCSTGYVRLHVARTADYDALLTFWQVVVWTSLFRYLETSRSRALLWLAVGLTAAVLTKSVAGLLALPGLLVYTLFRGRLLWLLRQPRVYAAAAAFGLIVVGYFAGRNLADPGYWQEVLANDLGGRYLTDLQIHGHPADYYLNQFRNGLFLPWLWLLLPALLLVLVQPVRRLRWAAVLLTCFASSWFIVISTAASKLEWYDAPIYPALALLVGLGLALVLQALREQYLPAAKRPVVWLAGTLATLVLFFTPYETVVNQIIKLRYSDFGIGPDGHLARYLSTTLHKDSQLDSVTALYSGGYNATLTFYKMLYQEHQKELAIYPVSTPPRVLQPGTVALVCDPDYAARLDSVFQIMELKQDESCHTLLLVSRKGPAL